MDIFKRTHILDKGNQDERIAGIIQMLMNGQAKLTRLTNDKGEGHMFLIFENMTAVQVLDEDFNRMVKDDLLYEEREPSSSQH